MVSPQPRELDTLVSWTFPERLRCRWYRLRMTVREMNYASCLLFDPRVLVIPPNLTNPARDPR